MRRVPLLATALVLIAIAVMIALGMWQLRRAEWKETLTARAAGNLLEATADLPATLPPGLDYRRFRVSCERIECLQPKAGTGGSSDERREGKEWVRTCRSRWSPYH